MMSNLTIARPYAKAIFDLALRTQQLSTWHDTLKTLAMVATACQKMGLLNNPRINLAQKIALFSEVTKLSVEATNFVQLLAERKKLTMLPDIANSYQQLFFDHNKILEARIVSASELTTTQKQLLTDTLEDRYQRKILLQCYTDSSLIGGAILYVADKVIDNSTKGLLQRLKQNLLLKEHIC